MIHFCYGEYIICVNINIVFVEFIQITIPLISYSVWIS